MAANTTLVSIPSAEPESMRRLQALKEKIQAELEAESRARSEEASREATIPLSLAQDYAAPKAPASASSPAARRAAKARGAATTKGKAETTGAGASRASEGQQALQMARDKVASMKLDKWVQRELETELDRQSGETGQLKAQNTRLREIIALRQQSNSRRESSMQAEIGRLSKLCDEACVDANDMDGTMGRLRTMNDSIQQGAEQLRATIEQQGEADKLQLARNYRVKIREVKQLLHEQKERNREGAQNWIERHSVLERDRDKAAEALQQLEVRNEKLEVQNRELDVMLEHQAEQRESLTTRVAVVKRENKRLEEHIAVLEEEVKRKQSTGGGDGSNTDDTPRSSVSRQRPGTRAGQRRATGHTQSSHGKMTESAVTVAERQQRRAAAGTSDNNPGRSAAEHQQVLRQLRRTLEHIRSDLRSARSAHVELLQERTELELFMRQCTEDVRRDIYRFTIVSNAGKTRGNGTERVLPSYSVDERRQLLRILQSKLRVFASLHAHMFPAKAGLHDEGDDSEEPPSGDARAAALSSDDMRALATAAGGSAAGVSSKQAEEPSEDTEAMEATVDDLWSKWRKWTTVDDPRR